MSPNPLLAQSTWRFLGFCVGTTCVGLGTTYAFLPIFSARVFGFLGEKESPTTPKREQLPAKLVDPVMQVIAVRDISFGLALLMLWNDGNDVAMGQVILSSLPIVVIDFLVLKRLGSGPGMLGGIAVGGTSWMAIGAALVGW